LPSGSNPTPKGAQAPRGRVQAALSARLSVAKSPYHWAAFLFNCMISININGFKIAPSSWIANLNLMWVHSHEGTPSDFGFT